MRSLSALMAVLLTAGALAGPAQAEQGTGLYAPFPSPSGGARAERFVGQLGVRANGRELTQGVGVGLAVGRTQASASARGRAGIDVPLPRGLLIALLGAAALGVTLGLAVWRDRPEDLVTEATN